MAPLSVLPGRVRFESQCLIGKKQACLLLEEVLSVHGVQESSASHRTGRILIRFDEKLISRDEIEKLLGRALKAVALQKECECKPSAPCRGSSASESNSGVGHLVMEMALHALLPGPLDLLLPVAATAFRR